MALTLEGKPWYVSLIVGLVIGGLAIFGAHRMKLGPMNKQIQRQEKKLADLHNQITRGQAARNQLPVFMDKVRRLELDLDKLLRILPERRNVDQLLRRVQALAEREDFVLSRVKPGREKDKEFISEWPITMNVRGNYHNLARFFDRISRISRIINVDSLRIDAYRSRGPHTIKAVFTAKTFVYKEQEEPEAQS